MARGKAAVKVESLPEDVPEDEPGLEDVAESNDVLEGDNRPPVYREGDCVIFRASGLDLCESALVAVLQGITPSAPPKMLQGKYQEGHQVEPIMLAELERRGWVIRGRQGAVDIFVCEMEDGTKVYIRGSYDALGCWNPDKEPDEAGNLYRVVDMQQH